MKFGEPISTAGGWGSILSIQGQPDLCAKVVASNRRHEAGQPDPAVEALTKYGIKDLLQEEYNNYRKIKALMPAELAGSLVQIHGIKKDVNGRRALIMNLVRDDQGEIAVSLNNNRRQLQSEFFYKLERLRREVFDYHAIDYFGIASRNILVRDPQTPVLIDFQKDRRWFRFQFWLGSDLFVRRKLKRYFKNIYTEQKQPDYTRILQSVDDKRKTIC